MLNYDAFNLMRYPYFWSEKTRGILKEQLKYTHWIFAKQKYNQETHERYKLYYANLPLAFDIEDTSFYKDDEKVSIMYVWQVGVNGIVYMGRTWEQFKELTEVLNAEASKQGEYYRYIIYVHFLEHEFQFMRKRFRWHDVFSRDTRAPIYAITGHIEFRDSYILTGKSLAKVADDIRTFKGLKKMVGDLDYQKMRGSKTHLTRKEIKYCMADVQILNVVIMEKMQDENNRISNIPLTNTGYVRKYCRRACFSKRREHKKYSYIYYKGIHKLTLEPKEYQMLQWAFQGGFTHANPLYVGDVIKGRIDSIDFVSSYPGVLLSNLYPASKGVKVKVNNIEEFNDYLKNYLSIFVVKFEEITQKDDAPDSIISYSKCDKRYTKDAVLNNGRVVSAGVLVTCVTSTDFEMIRKFYNYKCYYIGDMYIYKKGLLPKSIIQCVLDFYKAKTTLKGVDGMEVEYLLKKGMLNSVYGMMVTNIVKPLIICDEHGEWKESEEKPLNESIQQYNDNKKRFLFYPWGVWVTAYARQNLLNGILEFGNRDYIYSDTDSIKCLNLDKHMDYVERYNKNIQDRIEKVLEIYKIDKNECKPKNNKGIEKPLGVWDIETIDAPYTRFKTLGAKRYIMEEKNDIYITIAGVSKTMGKDYIKKQSDPFKFFDDDMEIPELYSGKLTHTYIDDERKGTMIDYQGNINYYDELSSVHLEPTSYKMNILEEYKLYLKGYKGKWKN